MSRNLKPGGHLVDKGYTDAHVLVESQREYGVTILGPVVEVPNWQPRAGAGSTAAIDVVRLDDWGAGRPVAGARCSRFAALQPAA